MGWIVRPLAIAARPESWDTVTPKTAELTLTWKRTWDRFCAPMAARHCPRSLKGIGKLIRPLREPTP